MSAPSYSPPMKLNDVCVFDTETTCFQDGLSMDSGEIVDLAAIRFTSEMVEISRTSNLCAMQWPDKAEPEALKVNGYSAQEWAAKAVHIRVALIEFSEAIAGCVGVAHNCRFDMDFLQMSFRRESMKFPRTKYILDSCSLAWPLVMAGVVQNVKLDTVCSAYGVSNEGAHRAMTDVKRTAIVYAKMMGKPDPVFAR